jgi:hypothetical protein
MNIGVPKITAGHEPSDAREVFLHEGRRATFHCDFNFKFCGIFPGSHSFQSPLLLARPTTGYTAFQFNTSLAEAGCQPLSRRQEDVAMEFSKAPTHGSVSSSCLQPWILGSAESYSDRPNCLNIAAVSVPVLSIVLR